jgi:hypothetical protein
MNSADNVITYSKVRTALQKSTQQLPLALSSNHQRKTPHKRKKKTNPDVTFINKKERCRHKSAQ